MGGQNLLDQVATSSFPVAIGTGLMLESLFTTIIDRVDVNRVIPNFIKVNDYDYHMYNIYTIIRNILTAIPYKNKVEILTNAKFRTYVADEVEAIFNLYENSDCTPALYIPDYSGATKYYNMGKSKLSGYLEEHEIMVKVVKGIKFMNSVNIIPKSEMKSGYRLPKTTDKILLTTSYALDLHNNLPNMFLLESHTGKLKSKLEFSSKYKKSASYDVSTLPFNEFIHYAIGDNTLVAGLKTKYKKQLFNIALDKKWTPRTTDDKIRSNINTYSPDLSFLLSVFKKQY